jgi:hypothetical protein
MTARALYDNVKGFRHSHRSFAGLRFSTLYQREQSRLARIAAAKRSRRATNQSSSGSENIYEELTEHGAERGEAGWGACHG